MYTVKSLPARQWGIIQRINNYICDLNAGREGTPTINRCLFGRANGCRLFSNFERLVDEAHPSQELAAEMSALLDDFLGSRNTRRRSDLRQRLENIREEREEDVVREMAEIQDRIIIIGNSIASYLRVGEAPRVARSGRTLTDIMHDITYPASRISEDRRRRDRQEREEEPQDREIGNRYICMDVPRRRDLV